MTTRQHHPQTTMPSRQSRWFRPRSTAATARKADEECGGRLVSRSGSDHFALRGASVEVEACAGLARVVLRQTFANSGPEPLQATYQFPLPADAAVGGYVFTVGGERIEGEIDRRRTARQRFDEAVLEGRSAALLDQERTSIFTQEIGNIPPGEEVTCEITLDQKLTWLETGQWEWRFPTVIGPRYLSTEGRVPDAGRISPPVADVPADGLPFRAMMKLRIRDRLTSAVPASPSHPAILSSTVASGAGEAAATDVTFADEAGVALDRDIVIRWNVAAPSVGLQIDVARPPVGTSNARRSGPNPAASSYGLITLVPPGPKHARQVTARDMILLIDTSGSMAGGPLRSAKKVAEELVRSMGPADQLEMIEFSMHPRRWKPAPVRMSLPHQAEALKWIHALAAGGGTEMQDAIIEALRPLREHAKRQVVLLSDGYIGFERDVVSTVRSCTPPGCILHSVGIGEAANRSLTAAVARAGRGVEFLINPEEDHAEAVARIVRRLARPLFINLTLGGDAVLDAAAHELPDLHAGVPTTIPVRLRPEGGNIEIEGHTAEGPWRMTATAPRMEAGEGNPSVVRCWARERVEELELRAAGDASALVEVDHEVEQIGLAYGILTRLTSWVAISSQATVDPSDPIRRESVPQAPVAGMAMQAMASPAAARRIGPSDATVAYCRSIVITPEAAPGDVEESAGRAFAAWDEDDALGDVLPCMEAAAPAERYAAMAVPCDLSSSAAPPATGDHGIEVDGAMILMSADRLVIEINVTHPTLEWRPTQVLFDGPTPIAMEIDLRGTTRSGSYYVGQRLRLVLRGLPAGLFPQFVEGARLTIVGAKADGHEVPTIHITLRASTAGPAGGDAGHA